MKKLNGCIAKDGEEIDGREFEIELDEVETNGRGGTRIPLGNVRTFVKILNGLKQREQVHLNYIDDEDDLDIWMEKK